MKKRVLILMIAVLLSFTALVSCGDGNTVDADRHNIVCSTFPQYDWVLNILGNRAVDWNVTLLLDSGADLHNYQPTADDIIAINSADLFIYVGGESDEWADAVMMQGDGSVKPIVLMEIMKGNLIKEEHEHDEDDHHDEDHKHIEDEHVWLSLENAEVLCESITREICNIDPLNSINYKDNCERYTEALSVLDDRYEDTVENARYDALVFGDRYPFAYMAHDYDLTCYAAFEGCSAETEASFETVISLAQKIDELKLASVVVIEGSDIALADTIIANTKSKDLDVITLDSMQTVTRSDIDAGVTYISIMESNLAALDAALN